MKSHAQQFLQKRKFLMALPILVLPFVTVFFWALGGGQGATIQARPIDSVGLNVNLPDAHFDEEETWDKFALYEMAERDSDKYEEARESDPYFDLIAFQTTQTQLQNDTTQKEKLISGFKQKDQLAIDPNEEKVNRKLQELYNEISKPAQGTPTMKGVGPEQPLVSDPQFTSDVSRLEALMETMHSEPETDPEMEQIEGVLEKILDIQHPERVKEKLALHNELEKAGALPVQVAGNEENISLMSPSIQPTKQSIEDSTEQLVSFVVTSASTNGFYGLDDEVNQADVKDNSIQAVIHDTQELVAGSTVKMRLLTDIQVDGRTIPKDQLIYGICAINGERLMIEIKSIRTGQSLLPIALTVFDLDGLQGIYIPGAIARDAAKQASDNALQNIQLMSLNPSIGAQAAAAGVEAAKGLFSKKAKLIKVTVKAGYQILLKDTSPTNQTNF
jgi:conjugative transposon TraM protein